MAGRTSGYGHQSDYSEAVNTVVKKKEAEEEAEEEGRCQVRAYYTEC